MGWLDLQFLGDIGSTALVVLFVLAILTGRLRPQSAVREIREDRDARLAEAKSQYQKALDVAKIWEEAYRTTEAARRDQAKVLDDLITTVKAMQVAVAPPTQGGVRNDAQET